MENPEEVLQALDEFQKMRPSEIPRELEEYLCWVAKTGDPVYQWSLVKPLFREKLTRVMTDFYESCPSLDLAPCPNVDQFNYDIMKCALLELLDSFANAPFTVQRICELLTSPRKEYNRVDKFMRAIEKNILVVSTREPGAAARRSENGDGMVNGSVDDDALSSQSTHEVEMESWVKDCTAESTVAVSPGHSEAPLLDSVITGKAPKIITTCDESSHISEEKSQVPASKVNAAGTSLHSNISGAPSLVPPDVAPEVCDTNEENCLANANSAATTINDVPEAVMNEDTSSQPSLESEADETESAASRKLQTIFQPNDFVKEPKLDTDESSEEDKPSKIETADPVVQATSSSSNDDSNEKSKLMFGCQKTAAVVPIVESLVEKRPRSENDVDDTCESGHNEAENGSPLKKACSVLSEPTETSTKTEDLSTTDLIAGKTEQQMEDETIETAEGSRCAERLSPEENSKLESSRTESNDADNCLPEPDRVSDATENSRPIIEEPSFDETSQHSSTSKNRAHETTTEQPETGVTIEEAMDDDDTKVNKSIIPDPIPIVEEPKEAEPTCRDTDDSSTTITELPDNSKNLVENVETSEINVITEATIIEEPAVGAMNEEALVVEQTTRQDDITDVRTEPVQLDNKIEPAESMEVDADEPIPAFQQDEPMEQEPPPGDLIKS